MSSRYDFVKDPKDRQWIARCQSAAALLFLALLVAMVVYGPTVEEAVARRDGPAASATQPAGAQPRAAQPGESPIGRGEGA